MATKMVKIDVPQEASYSEMPLTLRGVTYKFTLRWNWRAKRWTADWQMADGVMLAAGVPIHAGRNAIAPFIGNSRLPYGALVAVDTTGANQDPTLSSFASTHVLVFAYND